MDGTIQEMDAGFTAANADTEEIQTRKKENHTAL